MPLYTVITPEHALSGETKRKMAEEITRIHAAVMKVPQNFVRVVFLPIQRARDTPPAWKPRPQP